VGKRHRLAGSTLATMRVDISSERDADGWVRVTCDAPGRDESVEGRPRMGEECPHGWVQDLRRTPAWRSATTTGSAGS
jgi:hypothetical protein